jgi:monovalent cation:H+ antiporter, CPA1 family
VDLAQTLLEVSLLLASAVVLGLLARRVHIPPTVVLAVVGFLASSLGGTLALERQLAGEGFQEVLVFLFLPILVFQAVLDLPVRSFLSNLGPILVLALVALGISTALVGLALRAGLDLPLATALVFGALISATDPVAVVAVFREVGVPGRLLTLVEGESLLNDGVAIVLFNILLAAALGAPVSVASGAVDFLGVFCGGAALGAALGFAVALVLPWLDRLSAAALSLAVAYGSFVLADHVLGFSGVMATVAAGLVLAGLAPSRASAEARATWGQLWEALDHVANAVLFLLIGLVIDVELLTANLGPIALAVVVVLVARALAVVPCVAALDRFAGIPPVGLRNQAVLVWGGLRGGVALALALALPEDLADRETLVAMTGGVVLATLILNATTIASLVRRLGLDQLTRAEHFLAAGGHLSGVLAARRRLDDLGLDDPVIAARLEAAEASARQELRRIELTPEEELQVVTRRGLAVERTTYQHLSDAGLLPPDAARALLHEVDDLAEEAALGRPTFEPAVREPPPVARLVERLLASLPEPVGHDPSELAYAEAMARQLAARRTIEAFGLFDRLPNIDAATVEQARQLFVRWERDAVAALEELDRSVGEHDALRLRQAEALTRMSSQDALDELSAAGLLPAATARRAAEEVAREAEAGSP